MEKSTPVIKLTGPSMFMWEPFHVTSYCQWAWLRIFEDNLKIMESLFKALLADN